MARFATRGDAKVFEYVPHVELFNSLALKVIANEIKNLIVMIPPQHGKTTFWSEYFPAWFLGNFPDKYVILASYSTKRARSSGRRARNAIQKVGPKLFGVSVDAHRYGAEDWGIHGRQGGMVSAGFGGSITGNPATIAIIDDPIKGEDEAFSQAHKDGQWEWYQSVITSRVHENGHKIVISTRWAQDDLIGRIKEELVDTGREDWTIIRLPAIAEEDEDFFGWTRKRGKPLWRPLEFLESTRQNISPFWWATLWQQRPYPRAGMMFQPGKINVVTKPSFDTLTAVRGWDLAATVEAHSKRTAGVLIERGTLPRRFRIADVKLGKWTTNDRNDEMNSTMEIDGPTVFQKIEQEPGSSGIDQRETLQDEFSEHWVDFERVTGKKELRADAVATAVNRGEFEMVRGDWNRAFIAELESYPNGRYKDQVDALSAAYNWLIKQPVPSNDTPSKAKRNCECGRWPHHTWCANRFDEEERDPAMERGPRASDFRREFEQ